MVEAESPSNNTTNLIEEYKQRLAQREQTNKQGDLSQKSVLVEEPALERLFEWVRENGGQMNCQCR